MRMLLPEPGTHDLDEAALVDACAPDDRLTPRIRVNFIAALDGAVTLDGRSGGLGNATDQEMMARLRLHADVVLVGAGTIRAEGYGPIELTEPARAWRTARGMTPDPRMAILTRSGDVPAKVLAGDPIILTESAKVKAELAAFGLPQILCEGGPHTFGALAAAEEVDELFLTLSPLLVGPGPGRIIAGERFDPQALRIRHALTDGELLYLRYSVRSGE
jgi:riboflavin biosynthesis pyrimidine reductase